MILHLHCAKCMASFAVSAVDPDLRLLQKTLPCTDTACMGTLKKVKIAKAPTGCKDANDVLRNFEKAGHGHNPRCYA